MDDVLVALAARLSRGERLSMRAVAHAIASHHRLTFDNIICQDRRAHVVHARYLAMAACRAMGFTHHQIGRRFNRDHSISVIADRRYGARARARIPPCIVYYGGVMVRLR